MLGNKISKEIDAQIVLYTRDFGKVLAKAKSARKMTSKLNGHLQPLNFINARLIEKSAGGQRFQVVDALTVDYGQIDTDLTRTNAKNIQKFLNIAEFINEMTFELHQDLRLWQAIKKIFSHTGENLSEKIIYRGLLKILGFDPEHASCVVCGNSRVDYFSKTEHVFLCAKCACLPVGTAGKIDKNQLSLI